MKDGNGSNSVGRDRTLIEVITPTRLTAYSKPGEPIKTTLERYYWDEYMSATLTPIVHAVEVSFRNALDEMIIRQFGEHDWLVPPHPSNLNLSDGAKNKVKNTVARYLHEEKSEKTLSHNETLVLMNFGFWIGFLESKYEYQLWHNKDNLVDIFPNMDRSLRTRENALHKLLGIKRLRNRIAHIKSLYKLPLLELHADCMELIKARSTDTYAVLKARDRFPAAWEEGKHLL